MEYLPEVGVGAGSGALLAIVLREVLAYLKNGKRNKENKEERITIAADLLVSKELCTERHKRIDESLARIEHGVCEIREGLAKVVK